MNLKEFFIKRKIFILGISLLILIGGGFFYYWQFYETPPEKWDEAKYSKPEDYEVIETPEGLIVENKKAGLSFKVPEGWRVEKGKRGNYIAIYSPDIIGSARRQGGIEKGCEIVIEITNIKTNVKTIEERLKELHKTWEYPEKYETIEVNGRTGLKNLTGIPSLNLYGIGIHIPLRRILDKSRLYYLGISSNFEDRERCFKGFDEFLKTVLIK